MKKTIKNSLVVIATLATASSQAATWKAGNTDLTFKGYIKLDWVHVEGAGSNAALSKQITTPSQISEDSTGGRNGFQILQSRFGFGTSTPTEMGVAKSYIEMDYYLSPGGTETISNSSNPRLRHAFFNVGEWTFGQTWSTFMFLPGFNEQLDFGGYAGTNFVRQSMIRYSKKMGTWKVEAALENAETTSGTGTDSTVDNPSTTTNEATTIATDSDSFPDIIARVSNSGDYGSFAASAMLRKHNSDEVGKDDTGLALTAGAKINYSGKSNIRMSVSQGNLGRYGSFTAFKDAVIVNDSKVEATKAFQFHAGIQQYLSHKLRFNVDYGMGKMDTFTSLGIENVNMIHVNLIRQAMKNFQYGVEWSKTNVERFGSLKTDAKAKEVSSNRYMFSAQYSF